MLGCLEVKGLLVLLKEFGYTGKPQHTLWVCRGWEFSVSSLGLEEIDGCLSVLLG